MTSHHCGQPRPEDHETGDFWRCDYCGHTYRLRFEGLTFDIKSLDFHPVLRWGRVWPWDFGDLVALRRQEHLDRARAAAGWDVRPPFWADPTGGVDEAPEGPRLSGDRSAARRAGKITPGPDRP